jgi:hypothetical protein
MNKPPLVPKTLGSVVPTKDKGTKETKDAPATLPGTMDTPTKDGPAPAQVPGTVVPIKDAPIQVSGTVVSTKDKPAPPLQVPFSNRVRAPRKNRKPPIITSSPSVVGGGAKEIGIEGNMAPKEPDFKIDISNPIPRTGPSDSIDRLLNIKWSIYIPNKGVLDKAMK